MALTRPVPPWMAECELTHVAREPIDIPRAMAQHEAYEEALRSLGVEVRRLAAAPGLPDSVFIEDTAVVLPEVAVLMQPGAASRRPEIVAVEAALLPMRRVARIIWPGTMDGGDVLVVPQMRTIFVGLSTRTNAEGAGQFRAIVEPLGYRMETVVMEGCLHLKSAATQIAGAEEKPLLLVNPRWLPAGALGGMARLEIHPEEPHGANAIGVGGVVLHGAEFTLTRHILHCHGIRVVPVVNDELAKAEGALTCCSLIFESSRAGG
ncbi:MAG TPA: arginine deiminase-related protein [Phycisphaerae bacterium]|nr:arginine deiminase-related protein [Phycisphaerae bacterium]